MLRRCAPVLAILLPVGLSAQRADTSAVPRELVTAFMALNDPTGGNAQIVVGRLPEDRVAAMIPSGGRVLGGVTTGGQRGGRSTTFITMAVAPDSAMALVASQLERAGLKPAPAFESMRSGSGGGFSVTTIGYGPAGNMLNYCSDTASVFASAAEREGGSFVRLMVSRSLRNTMCDPAMRDRMRPPRFEELEMPTLRPPAGMTGGSAGTSSSGDSRETSVRLRGGQSPAELLDYFAPQLQEQGWTLSSRVTDGDAGMLSARKANSRGETVFLLVTDVRYTPREHDAMLRVWRQPENR